ncbi:hypothetical protein CN918_28890 [Priestia megaterium]|nr:hypothetical protein CN918_28890 [Priestia megaterium]
MKKSDSLTIKNLRKKLQLAAAHQITHEELVQWCSSKLVHLYNKRLDKDTVKAYSIAEGIDAQWDLYLSNAFSFTERQSLNTREIEMPSKWLEVWINKLEV